MTTTAAAKIPKGVTKLTDIEHAAALHMFVLCDGDLDATWRRMNKKHSKKTLKWYADRNNWYLTHEVAKNDLIAQALEDAKSKRKLDLLYLRETKSRLISQILDGYEIEIQGKTIVRQLRAKSLGEAVGALVNVIREERNIIGNTDGSDDDRPPSLLQWIMAAMQEAAAVTGGDGKPGNGRGNGGRFKGTESGEITDDDPFNIR